MKLSSQLRVGIPSQCVMWISSLALLMRVERGDYTTQVYTTNLLSETSVDAVKEGASQPRDVESLQYQQLYQQQQQPAHAAQPTVAPAS